MCHPMQHYPLPEISILNRQKIWIEKYFSSIPKGQAINLYRDFLFMIDPSFQKAYGVDKNIFNQDMFFASTDKMAVEKINEYSNMPTVVKRTEKDSEPINGVIKDIVYDNIQLPALFCGINSQNKYDDSYALEMMNQVLSDGSSSRINKTVVEKKQMARFLLSHLIMLWKTLDWEFYCNCQ